MATFYNFKRVYPNEEPIAVAGTAIVITFAVNIDALVIHSTIDLWVAPLDVATAGDGLTQNARQFVPAGVQRVLPWNSAACTYVNAVAGEGAAVAVRTEGWVQ